MASEQWLLDLSKRVERLEAAVFPEPTEEETTARRTRDNGCGYEGHPEVSHVCMSAGVPLSAAQFKWEDKDKLPFLTQAPLDDEPVPTEPEWHHGCAGCWRTVWHTK